MTTDLPVSRTGATDREVEAVARAIAASDHVDFDSSVTEALSLTADYRENAVAAITALDADRAAAVVAGEAVGVSAVQAVDLWAHLRSGPLHLGRSLSVKEAAAVVGLVIDLGWRPLVEQKPLPPGLSARPVQPVGAVTAKPSEQYL